MPDNALSSQKDHRRLAETLVDRFAQRMRDGVLQRGEKLPSELHIMEAEGVSRTVVRDALSRMQAAGLVETRHGVGTFVLDMPPPEGFSVGPATIATVSDVLNQVEAAGLAAQRRSPEALLELKRAFDALLEGPQKSGTTINADFQFHLKIAKRPAMLPDRHHETPGHQIDPAHPHEFGVHRAERPQCLPGRNQR